METLEKKKEYTLDYGFEKGYLINKKVFIKPIEGKDLTLTKKDKNHSAHSFMYEGAIVEWWLPMDIRGEYFNPFAEKATGIENTDERLFFEYITGRDLRPDPRNPECIWNTQDKKTGICVSFSVDTAVKQRGYELDLSKPYDMLRYKIAIRQYLVCEHYKNRFSKTHYVWTIVDGTEENLDNVKEFEMNSKLYYALGKIDESKEKMVQLIKLYFINNKELKDIEEETTSQDRAKSFLQELIKNHPEKLLATIDDPDKEYKILLLKAIRAGAIEKKGVNSYNLIGGAKLDLSSIIQTLKLAESKKDEDDTYGSILAKIDLFEGKLK